MFRDQHDGRVEMREGRRRRRVGQVVGGHVHGLDRGDRAGLGRGDALLQLAHFLRPASAGNPPPTACGRAAPRLRCRPACSGRCCRRRTARRGPCRSPVDVVAEVLGHRQAGQRDAQAVARRLVHLAVHHRDLVEDVASPSSRGRSRCPRGCARRRRRTPTGPSAAFAMLLISSIMLTVLPTPAPPNRPTLPPLANGHIRSMTLMPVSSSSLAEDWSS